MASGKRFSGEKQDTLICFLFTRAHLGSVVYVYHFIIPHKSLSHLLSNYKGGQHPVQKPPYLQSNKTLIKQKDKNNGKF